MIHTTFSYEKYLNENSDTSFFIIKMERIRVIGMSGANALDRFKEHVDRFGGTIEYWHQAHNKKAPCKAFVLINKLNSNTFVNWSYLQTIY